jgi:hypothetical protein
MTYRVAKRSRNRRRSTGPNKIRFGPKNPYGHAYTLLKEAHQRYTEVLEKDPENLRAAIGRVLLTRILNEQTKASGSAHLAIGIRYELAQLKRELRDIRTFNLAAELHEGLGAVLKAQISNLSQLLTDL